MTANEIRVGMTGPFSGTAGELGSQMQVGINTYFSWINDHGGVVGRKLKLIALDDGYDPMRALANMKELRENHQVFAYLGNVGTPTAAKTIPYALEHKMPFPALSPPPTSCAKVRPIGTCLTIAPATRKKRPPSSRIW